LRAWCG